MATSRRIAMGSCMGSFDGNLIPTALLSLFVEGYTGVSTRAPIPGNVLVAFSVGFG